MMDLILQAVSIAGMVIPLFSGFRKSGPMCSESMSPPPRPALGPNGRMLVVG